MFDSARSTFAAVTPFDPVYSSDQAFVDSWRSGAIMSGLQGAVMGGIMNTKATLDQNKVSKLIGDAYTQQFDAKD